jgi:hypothetical protein
MHPDTICNAGKAATKSLAEFFEIGSIADATHQPITRERYQQQVGEQIVEEAHDGLGLFVF